MKGLKRLPALRSLSCSNNQLTTLKGLKGFSSLQFVDCSNNYLTTLRGLRGVPGLQSLSCPGNRLTTLRGLKKLSALQSIDCSGNQLTTLRGLKELPALQYLHCFSNHLTTLKGLKILPSLQSIHCSDNPLRTLPPALIQRGTLKELTVFNTEITDIPVEVLSETPGSNCLETLRAHLRDLKEGDAALPDVKVMVLGNGRVGKTQLCNRLRKKPFEKNADSTHGITVAIQPFGSETILRLWDFGGQDIYHGTHALFIQNRAVFILVWTPDSENSATHEHAGIAFRNRPLAWWLAWVRHLAGLESPVLLVQNQCDRPSDGYFRPPVNEEALKKFSFHKVLHYSALNQQGESDLKNALHQAVEWLRKQRGQARIGKGRLAVKTRLDSLLTPNGTVAGTSTHWQRTLSMGEYEAICKECGGVSKPSLLLDYLHRSGVVLYKPGLFGNRIVLDQRWALEAVYTVFNRKACYQSLKALRGRFTRSLLEILVWQDYSQQEQELFLEFMQTCGICFVHRQGNHDLAIETEYLAPDLLPDYAEVKTEVESQWNETLPGDEATVELPFLHPGVMRNLLSRIGGAAGMAAVYWRDGVCLFENTAGSYARIEQHFQKKGPEWRGSIVIRTQSGHSVELLEILRRWVLEAVRQAGLQPVEPSPQRITPRVSALAPAANGVPAKATASEAVSSDPKFGPPPRTRTTYAVSYAWRGQSVQLVEELCRKAALEGSHVLRDAHDLGLGERISSFMERIAREDRIFVILSDHYLRSESCMFELKEIWRWCRQNEESLRQQVRVFQMPGLDISDFDYQLAITEYWVERHEAVKQRVTSLTANGKLSEPLLRRFNNLSAFAEHAGVIVPYIANWLRPKDFEEFLEYGFSD